MSELEAWHYNRDYQPRNKDSRSKMADIKYHLQEDSSNENIMALAVRHEVTAGYIRNIKRGNAALTVLPECNCESD